MRVIAVVNQKGGVGKTTTSVNLGAALARRGRRVLLVDMDPQGNLTDHLLGDPEAGGERLSIYDVIVEGKPIADAILATATAGLFVVPSHPDLAGAELDLASIIGREVLLRDALEALEAASTAPGASFDFVFLDCPPSLGLLSLNALAASQQVFIALQTEFFAMRGLGALDRTVDLVRRRINPALEVGGIIPTLVDSTRLAREVVDEVRGHYGDKVFVTKIRTNIRLAEAPSHGKHIFDYAPESTGATDYAQLAKELEEGRASVEAASPEVAAVVGGAGAVPGVAPSPGAPTRPTAAPLRGIAKAIAEATAAVSAGRPVGTSSVSAPVKSAGHATPMPAPTAPRPATAGATTPGPATTPAAPTRSPAPAPAPTPPQSTSPQSMSPRSTSPRSTSVVPLPVLRSGAKPIPLTPMPTRPLSALPRPATAAAGPQGAGTTGRS